MKINEKIKQLRLARGWSQAKLAELLNLSQQRVQKIESGEFKPSFDTLENIAKVFALENKYLVECG